MVLVSALGERFGGGCLRTWGGGTRGLGTLGNGNPAAAWPGDRPDGGPDGGPAALGGGAWAWGCSWVWLVLSLEATGGT